MAVVAPFMGLTYDFQRISDLSKLVAPPYDVISREEADAFYEQDPHNVVRLILGKKKKGDSDWDNTYTRAANYFHRWQDEGILVRTPGPALYLTAMSFRTEEGGRELTRLGLIALVRIEEENSGVVLPHERTFSAHKEDRLRLMKTCNAQFSQVFGLYDDPDHAVLGAFESVLHSPPRAAFRMPDGTSHRLWVIRDESLARHVARQMSSKSILIADGHHRYETARNYRNMMRARYGRRPGDRAYEYVMMYLSNMNDEGLIILPTHRVIRYAPGFRLEKFMGIITEWFQIRKSDFPKERIADRAASIKKRLAASGARRPAFFFFPGTGEHAYELTLKPGASDQMGDDLHPALRKLDVLVLSRFLLQRGLGFTKADLDNDELIHYESSMKRALSLVAEGSHQMAFLMNPTRMEHVIEIAGNGLVMPRKSTFFHPKVITGLVFNKIDPHERIPIP